MSVKLVAIIVIVSLCVVFLIQNVASVDVVFLLWSITLSRALLIFFTLVTGFVLGWFLHSYVAYRQARQVDRSFDASLGGDKP
jgi:uncharacterized integral membrane protein